MIPFPLSQASQARVPNCKIFASFKTQKLIASESLISLYEVPLFFMTSVNFIKLCTEYELDQLCNVM